MKYETQAGNHIEGTFVAMVALANKHKETVESDFNGETLIVVPGDDAGALLAAWQSRVNAQRKAYEESPEGIKATADAKASQDRAEAKVKSVHETTAFKWTDGMREISGFGGGYEAACRAMVSAGVEWLAANPKAEPKFHGYKGITGIITEDNDDAQELSKAVSGASGGDCTGAMHQFAISHALHAHKIGWPAYVKMMIEARQNETADAR